MKVSYSPDTDADLTEIRHYIGRDSPRRAETFVRELVLSCNSLRETSFGFPVLRLKRPGLRRKMHGNYLIIHRVVEDAVEIVRVLHDARDIVRLPSQADA